MVAEGAREVTHRVLDRALRRKSEHAFHLVGIDVIGAHVVGRGRDDLDVALVGHFLLDHALHHVGNLGNRVILEADIEDFAVNFLVRRLQHQLIGVDHVLDVQVGPHLVAAEDGDNPFVHRVVGQDVHRQVEPRARAIAANRGRPHDDAGEIVGFVLPQQRLAHPLEFVVERQRHQRMFLGHVGRVGDAVD